MPTYLQISRSRTSSACFPAWQRPGPARANTVEAIARRLGEAQCPVLMFGDDVWREGAQAEAVRLAEALEAPVFTSRQIFANFPTRHPLFCGNYPASKDFEKVTGLKPDLPGEETQNGNPTHPFRPHAQQDRAAAGRPAGGAQPRDCAFSADRRT